MAKELPSPELLRKLLRYEPETGKLYWRERTPDMFVGRLARPEHSCKRWNTINAKREAGSSLPEGYRQISVFGTNFLSHRIVWALYYGKDPEEHIDHINGNRTDNRISNLRVASPQENSKNQRKGVRNTSGVLGVNWSERLGKWRAEISVKGKNKHLGLFDTLEEAYAVRKEAEKKYGFHENHGRG